MGAQFSVKNSKYEVSCDLEDSKSIISFKVQDRREKTNPQHFIHYKRYKHFQLPARIKVKFKTVSQLHQFLAKNAEVITIGQKDIIIDLDGDKVNVPFENVNQESKIFCETQNIEQDRKKENRQNEIHIVIGNQIPGQRRNNAIQSEDEESKTKIKKVLKKMIKKNNPLREVDLEELSLKEIAERLTQQWGNFDKNGPVVPNMTKKKTQEAQVQKQAQSSQIQKVKTQLSARKKQLQVLRIQFDVRYLNYQMQTYKQEWNFQKFASEHRKTQELTKKRVTQQLLQEISEYSSQMSVSMSASTSNIKVQMRTKAALFSWIENMTRELSDYRSKEEYATVKKEVRKQKPGESQISSGFSDIMEKESLSSIQKRDISVRLSFDKK